MSYTLHVWESPAPATVEEAYEFIFERDHGGLRPSARFPAFAKALLAEYPDMETLAEAGEDQDEAVWVDGRIDGKTDSAVYVLGLTTSRMDDDVLAFIADTAADHGLYVYDMQGDMLFRPDRTLLMRDGTVIGTPGVRSSPKPARREAQPRKTKSRKPVLKPMDCMKILFRDAGALLALQGWETHLAPENVFRCTLTRQRGEIRQQLYFNVSGMTDNSTQVHVMLGFAAEAIREAWLRALPEDEKAEWLTDKLQAHILVNLRDLFPSATELEPAQGVVYLHSPDEAAAWAELFSRWWAKHAGPRLDACDDLASLHRLLLADRRLRADPDGFSLPMLGTLVLSHLVDPRGNDFDAWLAAVRDRQRRDCAGYIERYRSDPQAFGGQVPFQVHQSERIDRLVEALQRERAGR